MSKKSVEDLNTKVVKEPRFIQRRVIGYWIVWSHRLLVYQCRFPGKLRLGVIKKYLSSAVTLVGTFGSGEAMKRLRAKSMH